MILLGALRAVPVTALEDVETPRLGAPFRGKRSRFAHVSEPNMGIPNARGRRSKDLARFGGVGPQMMAEPSRLLSGLADNPALGARQATRPIPGRCPTRAQDSRSPCFCASQYPSTGNIAILGQCSNSLIFPCAHSAYIGTRIQGPTIRPRCYYKAFLLRPLSLHYVPPPSWNSPSPLHSLTYCFSKIALSSAQHLSENALFTMSSRHSYFQTGTIGR